MISLPLLALNVALMPPLHWCFLVLSPSLLLRLILHSVLLCTPVVIIFLVSQIPVRVPQSVCLRCLLLKHPPDGDFWTPLRQSILFRLFPTDWLPRSLPLLSTITPLIVDPLPPFHPLFHCPLVRSPSDSITFDLAMLDCTSVLSGVPLSLIS